MSKDYQAEAMERYLNKPTRKVTTEENLINSRTMTKLEIQLFNAMDAAAFKLADVEIDPNEECNQIDRAMCTAAAEVCKGYVERAFDEAYKIGVSDGSAAQASNNYNNIGSAPKYVKWLKSEGITE